MLPVVAEAAAAREKTLRILEKCMVERLMTLSKKQGMKNIASW